MVTGEIRSQIDRIRNDFWSGCIANPLSLYLPINASELLFPGLFQKV